MRLCGLCRKKEARIYSFSARNFGLRGFAHVEEVAREAKLISDGVS
jgi:hypothetical protein